MKNLLTLLFIALYVCAAAQTKVAKHKPVDTPFSIQISGKLSDNCPKPVDLYFGEFHGADHDIQTIDVNANGEFSAKFILKEPGLVYIKKGMYSQYFIVTPKEKVYKLDLTCTYNGLNPIQVNNSKENKTYEAYLNLHKKFLDPIESYRDKI